VDIAIDATYGRNVQRRAIENMSQQLGLVLVIFELVVKPEDAVMRFDNRKNHTIYDDLTRDRVFKLAREYQYGWRTTCAF
jgi:predicted kinase